MTTDDLRQGGIRQAALAFLLHHDSLTRIDPFVPGDLPPANLNVDNWVAKVFSVFDRVRVRVRVSFRLRIRISVVFVSP